MNARHLHWLLLCLAILAILATGVSGSAYAQQDVDLDESVDADALVDDARSVNEVDHTTPLRTARGFMHFAEVGDFETAAVYLDLRYLPEELDGLDGVLLAEQLYVVISRAMPIDFAALSDEPGGVAGDGLPSYRDELGSLDTPQGDLAIYLQSVPGTDDSKLWKISNASVARVPDLYEVYGYNRFVELARELVPRGSFLGVELFKWIISVLAGLGVAFVWMLIAWPMSRILTRRNASNTDRVQRYLMRPVPAFIFIFVGGSLLKSLGLGVTASQIYKGGTLVTLTVVWLLFATVNLLRDLYAQYLRARGRTNGLMLLRPLTSTAKVLIATLATVVWLDNLGISVTALMAGLGVGGLAVALVLQKPLEDIMGAITLYSQQPVTVGQFCTCGDVTGTVEEINLRTTRIRTIANTVVVIPNAVFATASIENIAERHRILHRQTVRLALDTPAATISLVLEKLREILAAEDEVSDDSYRVTLVGLGEFSIDLEVFAHVNKTDWAEFLAIAENINLGTIKALEDVGAKLAVPPR